jgi:branched-chain amino acid transport system substrate-binding protein
MKLLLVIMLFIGIALSGCTSVQTTQPTPHEPIKIGAVLTLTGPTALYGAFSKAGIDAAVEDINAAGGIAGRKVVVIYEDAPDKKQTALATSKLVSVDHVDGLITLTTMTAGTMAPIAEENKIPFIYVAATSAFALNKTYVFKDYPDSVTLCRMLMTQAKEEGHTKVAHIGMQVEFTDFCRIGAEQIRPLVSSETFVSGEKDFHTQLTKIKESGATAVIVTILAPDCANLFKQMREAGIDAQLYVMFHSFNCAMPGQKHDDLLIDGYGADIDLSEQDFHTRLLSFKQRFEEKGTTHLIGSAMMYDATTVLAHAYDNCTATDCAADSIRAVRGYKGISGTISYNGNQEVERDVALFHNTGTIWVKAK